jgi:divalent metal cation (Fe/Co/Zn/Cd) transporter
MREARRAPTRDHPLGYGMVVYFWAFLVSVLLFTVGGAFSIYEGRTSSDSGADEVALDRYQCSS